MYDKTGIVYVIEEYIIHIEELIFTTDEYESKFYL